MGSGGGLTESIDDLAAEEINELEGVLVLDGQTHEELGAGRAPSVCSTCSLAFDYLETMVDGTLTMTGWLSAGVVFIIEGAKKVTTCPLVTATVLMQPICVRGAACRVCPGAPQSGYVAFQLEVLFCDFLALSDYFA